MIARWVTATYLLYLAAPIVLLFAGSFGDLWLNTLLPTGVTGRWYAQVVGDPSFRRAFVASLFVATMTCTACVAIGLPLAYAVFKARSARVRAFARVLYQLPVALPPLVLAFGFILVYSSDTLPCRVPRKQWPAALRAHRPPGTAALGPLGTHRRRRAVDRRVPVLEPRIGLPQPDVSGRAPAGVLRRHRICLRRHRDPAGAGIDGFRHRRPLGQGSHPLPSGNCRSAGLDDPPPNSLRSLPPRGGSSAAAGGRAPLT